MSNNIKTSMFISFLISVLIFIGIADLPYGYYKFLRVAVFVLTIITVVLICVEKERLSKTAVFPILIGIMFNPLIPVTLDRNTWVIIDIVSGSLYVITIFVLLISYKNKKE